MIPKKTAAESACEWPDVRNVNDVGVGLAQRAILGGFSLVPVGRSGMRGGCVLGVWKVMERRRGVRGGMIRVVRETRRCYDH